MRPFSLEERGGMGRNFVPETQNYVKRLRKSMRKVSYFRNFHYICTQKYEYGK